MPTVQVQASQDCTIDQSSPGVNQDGNNLVIGSDVGASDKKEFLVDWDVASALPAGAVVTGCRILLYVQLSGKAGTFPLTCRIIRITSGSWDETTVTWNTAPTGSNLMTYEQPDIGADYWKVIVGDAALCSLLEDWNSGAANQYGLLFRLDDESPAETEYFEYDDLETGNVPILEIDYVTGETIPGTDPGDDLDAFSGVAEDEITGAGAVEPAHEVTWTIGSTEHDLTDYVQDLGEFRTVLPVLLENIETGDAVFTLDNESHRYSPYHRDSVIFGAQIMGTEIVVRSGVVLPGTIREMVEQYVGLVDYRESDSGAEEVYLKTRTRLQRIPDSPVEQSYSSEHPVDVLYDIVRNLLELDEDEVNVKSFYDVKDSLGANIEVTKAYTGELGSDVVNDLAVACRCSLYSDRRGRIAIHEWTSSLTAAGDEVAFTRDTNMRSLRVRTRDDLVLNYLNILWGSGLSETMPVTNTTSIGKYGKRSIDDLELDMLTRETDVNDLGVVLMGLFAEPPVEVEFDTEFHALLVDVGDQVVVTDEVEGFSSKVFVVVEKSHEPQSADATLRAIAPA